MILFVGNLDHNATEADLQKLFTPFGTIEAILLVKDTITHRSRGFGYVQMAEAAAANRAMGRLHDSTFMSKVIIVTDKGPRMGKHILRTISTP